MLSVAAPPVLAVDPTATLEISWTRPGTSQVFAPPAPLRVGDAVIVHVAMSGFFQPGCQTVFAGGGSGFNYPSMWIWSEPSPNGGCPDWTFVVPPSPVGEYRVETAAFEDSAISRPVVPLVIEAGGAPVPFASNYPVTSWSPQDLFGTDRLQFGAPIDVPDPPNATRCQLGFNGTWVNGFQFNAPDCATWTITVPELRPVFGASGPFAWPWDTGVMISADGQGPDGRRLNGTTYALNVTLDGDGSASELLSSEPAGLFQASANPYFFEPGPVPLVPTLVGLTSGSCEYQVRTPNATGYSPLGTTPIVDGQCAPAVVDAQELGGYQYDLRILNEQADEVAHAWAGFSVSEPIPPPVIDVPPDPPDTGDAVPIDVSVETGPATEYSVAVALDSGTAVPTGNRVSRAPAASCTGTSGQLDVLAGDRDATATCRFSAAGTYRITATMTDALGTVTSSSKTIRVNGLDTVAPTVSRPQLALSTGALATGMKVPVKIGWSAYDAQSGVARYRLALSTDGGAYVVINSSLTAATATPALTPGHTFRARVQAIDKAGNTGPWVAGPSFTVAATTETSPSIAYGGAWSTATSTAFLGGSARRAIAAGRSATFTFTGRSVAWLAAVGPGYGKVNVTVDGVSAGSVNLYAATGATRRIVFARSWGSVGTHSIRLVNVATPGHAMAIVDGFYSLGGTPLGSVSTGR